MFGFLFGRPQGRHQGRPQARPQGRLISFVCADRFVAATYRGCTDGWVASGDPRSLSDAQRLADLIGRIRPDFITRPVAA